MLAGDKVSATAWQWDEQIGASLTVPQNVRPCCAFGDMQRVKLGPIPVPFFRLNNVISPQAVGPHKFASGIYHYTSSSASASGVAGGENNGLMYTQYGGFIDLAHVRDTADDTIGLFFEVLTHLGKEHRIELPSELGPRYVNMQSFDVKGLSADQQWQLAAHLAARLAYFKAESHEIAQWHGYSSFSQWPETISAYSLEDLYSNMLGAKLSLTLIQQRKMLSESQYNQNLTLWLNASLAELGAQPKEAVKAVLAAVDGHWWDSKQSIPSKFMILKRHYQLGDHQTPYLLTADLVPTTKAAVNNDATLQQLANSQPTELALADSLYGLPLDELAQLVLEVDENYQPSFAHMPDSVWQQGIVHTAFQTIANYAEIEDNKVLANLEIQAQLDTEGERK
ncbi:hypothetical protein A3K86_16120 [Photobacterium jeanii]|uniref:DUF4056 domain-containing protein n=2 Tax=Photobacterium jeanii TaxID=858640 RepID=A0A178K7S2_9GAMM|nr:hypothetical protein A3K86_16120 [Photobacterium jeanii]PST89421.1 DUF4056 domain-containing protein [Photobacterium jeanii]